jgi:hypothetical protein
MYTGLEDPAQGLYKARTVSQLVPHVIWDAIWPRGLLWGHSLY